MMPLSNGKTPLVFMLCDGVAVQPGARRSSGLSFLHAQVHMASNAQHGSSML